MKCLPVSLDELYPLRDQTTACCDLTATAVALDLLRFFYQVLLEDAFLETSAHFFPTNQNLWMPWDDDSESVDWPHAHLTTRYLDIASNFRKEILKEQNN